MDTSYDGSFGSFSAGGKGPGGGVFDGEKNDVANDEIKLEQSAGDFNSTDLAVDHSKVADKAINIEPVDGAATDNQATDIVLTNNEVSSANTGTIDSADVTNSADATESASSSGSAGSSATDLVGAVDSTGSALVNDAATNMTPSSGVAINDGGVNAASTNSAITNTNTTSNFAANSGTITNSYAVDNNSTSTAMNSMLGSGTMGSGMMNGGVNNAGMMGGSMANWSTAGNADRNIPIVSVDANGVNLPNATDARSPKKGLIIGAIVIVLLALVGALVGFIFTGKGGGGQTVAAKPLKEAFNSYINYVWYGKDSDEDFDVNALDEVRPYYLEVKESGEGKEEYLAKVEEKYAVLEASFPEDDSEDDSEEESVDNSDSEGTSALVSYYHDYVKIGLSYNELMDNYLELGFDDTARLIEESYKTNNKDDTFLKYAEIEKKINYLSLDIVVQANAAGCIKDKKIKNNCYNMPDSTKEQYVTLQNDSYNQLYFIRTAASDSLMTLYEETYNKNEIGASEDEK